MDYEIMALGNVAKEVSSAMQRNTIKKIRSFLLVPFLIVLAACGYRIGSGDKVRSCFGNVPAASLAKASFGSDLLKSLVKQVLAGGISASFVENAATIFSDAVLREWVTNAIDCENEQRHDDDNSKGRLSNWLAEMTNVSKENPKQLAAWLRVNPVGCPQSSTKNKGSINGQDRINDARYCYRVNSIGRYGELTVKGSIPVTIGHCNGRIFHDENDRIIVKDVGRYCKWEKNP